MASKLDYEAMADFLISIPGLIATYPLESGTVGKEMDPSEEDTPAVSSHNEAHESERNLYL